MKKIIFLLTCIPLALFAPKKREAFTETPSYLSLIKKGYEKLNELQLHKKIKPYSSVSLQLIKAYETAIVGLIEENTKRLSSTEKELLFKSYKKEFSQNPLTMNFFNLLKKRHELFREVENFNSQQPKRTARQLAREISQHEQVIQEASKRLSTSKILKIEQVVTDSFHEKAARETFTFFVESLTEKKSEQFNILQSIAREEITTPLINE